MDDELADRMIQLLESIDGKLDRLDALESRLDSIDTYARSIDDYVFAMKLEVAGFEHEGRAVPSIGERILAELSTMSATLDNIELNASS